MLRINSVCRPETAYTAIAIFHDSLWISDLSQRLKPTSDIFLPPVAELSHMDASVLVEAIGGKGGERNA